MTISLAMIVKDGLADLKRLKPLVKDHIDQWVVVMPPKDPAIDWAKKNGIEVVVKDLTQPIEDKIAKEMRETYRVNVPDGYRLFNFAAARNESFKHATGDYILWLDADDEPVGLDKLREYIDQRIQVDMFDATYDYARDAQGVSVSDHIRERVMKNKPEFVWKGAELGLIHETVVYTGDITRLAIPKDIFYILHIPEEGHDVSSNVRNHIALLYEYIKTNGKDPRTTYYLGTSFFNFKHYDFCIEVLKEYIRVGGWDEERYRAWIRIAEAYHQIGDKESSRNAYLSAIKEMPSYPDAYYGIGESYHSDQEHEKAVEFITTGMGKEIPKTKSAIDYSKYLFRPLPFLALSNMELGKLKDAYYWFTKAKKMNPKHPWVVKYTETFEELKDLDEYVKAFTKLGQISQRLYPETLSKLAEAIPEQIMDQDILMTFNRLYKAPKVWGDKSIVYFCSSAFEEWGPNSLKTGTGGSEEAVIHLTKRWAKMGYEVTVYNNCPEEGIDENGVEWVRYERFNPKDEFNILISWRNNPFVKPKKFKKGIVDLHDVPPNAAYYQEKYLDGVDLFVKSQYHRSLLPDLPDDKFVVIPNGIELEQLKDQRKLKNNLVWTSSYNRGLQYLLEMWGDIRKEVPDATLDIAYGWNLWDMSGDAKTEDGKKWKAYMQKLMQQEGIRHHGRLNSKDVAELYLKAEVWAYPTDFPEIDCITATKAMASSCLPVTTDFAVMAERNQGVMIEGDIKDKAVFEEFKQELINVLKDDAHKAKVVNKISVENFDWDIVAQAWADKFEEPVCSTDKMISVIMPTYNRLKYLKEAVNSVLTQTYPNIELLIGNDGSEDGTKQWLDSIKDPRVRVFHFEHTGNPPVIHNKLIQEAKGDYHYNIDDDDTFWTRHALSKFMQAAEQTNADLIYADLMLMYPSKELLYPQQFLGWDKIWGKNFIPALYFLKADISKKIPYDENFKTAYDYERNCKFALANITAHVIKQPLYAYRQHGGQIQQARQKEQDKAMEDIKKKYKEIRGGTHRAE